MKNVKRFIYEKLVNFYGARIGSCIESFKMASLEGDHRGCEYCDKLIAKYLAKQEAYEKKLEAL